MSSFAHTSGPGRGRAWSVDALTVPLPLLLQRVWKTRSRPVQFCSYVRTRQRVGLEH